MLSFCRPLFRVKQWGIDEICNLYSRGGTNQNQPCIEERTKILRRDSLGKVIRSTLQLQPEKGEKCWMQISNFVEFGLLDMESFLFPIYQYLLQGWHQSELCDNLLEYLRLFYLRSHQCIQNRCVSVLHTDQSPRIWMGVLELFICLKFLSLLSNCFIMLTICLL